MYTFTKYFIQHNTHCYINILDFLKLPLLFAVKKGPSTLIYYEQMVHEWVYNYKPHMSPSVHSNARYRHHWLFIFKTVNYDMSIERMYFGSTIISRESSSIRTSRGLFDYLTQNH